MSGAHRPPRSATLAERMARYWRAANRLADLAEADIAVGATPADAVLRHDRVTLWRYRPSAPRCTAPPLLIVHGFIGRASIADLAPDRSLVAALLADGHDVFGIHWGSPSRADRFMAIEDYLEDSLDACVGQVARLAGRQPVLLGICEGGLFALCFAALEPGAVAGLALAITPVDPHAAPGAVIPRWAAAFSPDDIARLVDCLGCVPGAAIGAAFQAMTPGRTRAKYTAGLLAEADDPAALRDFLRMEAWLRDRPDHPGEAARQLLVEHYGESRLAHGGWRLGGRLADPARLRGPIFSAYGLRDHLVPAASARAIVGLAPGAVHTDCPLDTGHVGVFVSRRARGLLAARLSAWLQASFGAKRA